MKSILFLLVLSTGLPDQLWADNTSNIATSLMNQRSRVEELNNNLQSRKSLYEARIRAAQARLADLEASIQRQELSNAELNNQIESAGPVAPTIDEQEQRRRLGIIDRLRKQIAASLNFKRAERLKALNSFADDPRMLTSDAGVFYPRLWTLMDDELRMQKDTGIFREVITIGGKDKLSEAARIGLLAMYFRTLEGESGIVRPGAEPVLFRSEENKEAVNQLIASMKLQNDGEFYLPAILCGPGNGGAECSN